MIRRPSCLSETFSLILTRPCSSLEVNDEIIPIMAPNPPTDPIALAEFYILRSSLSLSPVLADFFSSPYYAAGTRTSLYLISNPAPAVSLMMRYLQSPSSFSRSTTLVTNDFHTLVHAYLLAHRLMLPAFCSILLDTALPDVTTSLSTVSIVFLARQAYPSSNEAIPALRHYLSLLVQRNLRALLNDPLWGSLLRKSGPILAAEMFEITASLLLSGDAAPSYPPKPTSNDPPFLSVEGNEKIGGTVIRSWTHSSASSEGGEGSTQTHWRVIRGDRLNNCVLLPSNIIAATKSSTGERGCLPRDYVHLTVIPNVSSTKGRPSILVRAPQPTNISKGKGNNYSIPHRRAPTTTNTTTITKATMPYPRGAFASKSFGNLPQPAPSTAPMEFAKFRERSGTTITRPPRQPQHRSTTERTATDPFSNLPTRSSDKARAGWVLGMERVNDPFTQLQPSTTIPQGQSRRVVTPDAERRGPRSVTSSSGKPSPPMSINTFMNSYPGPVNDTMTSARYRPGDQSWLSAEHHPPPPPPPPPPTKAQRWFSRPTLRERPSGGLRIGAPQMMRSVDVFDNLGHHEGFGVAPRLNHEDFGVTPRLTPDRLEESTRERKARLKQKEKDQKRERAVWAAATAPPGRVTRGLGGMADLQGVALLRSAERQDEEDEREERAAERSRRAGGNEESSAGPASSGRWTLGGAKLLLSRRGGAA